jgi:hypothetical protein
MRAYMYRYWMLISMAAASSGIPPEELAAIAAAAGTTVVTGVAAATRSELDKGKITSERLRLAETVLLQGSFEPRTQALQELQFREMKYRFREQRVYSLLFLVMILLFAAVFLWGGVSLILGVTTAHVVTLLASAIPGVGSALFKYASNIASKQSDDAFKMLAKRVEDMEAAQRRETSIIRIDEQASRDTLSLLEAIKSIVPDATPEQLASIVKGFPTSSEQAKEE